MSVLYMLMGTIDSHEHGARFLRCMLDLHLLPRGICEQIVCYMRSVREVHGGVA